MIKLISFGTTGLIIIALIYFAVSSQNEVRRLKQEVHRKQASASASYPNTGLTNAMIQAHVRDRTLHCWNQLIDFDLTVRDDGERSPRKNFQITRFLSSGVLNDEISFVLTANRQARGVQLDDFAHSSLFDQFVIP